MSELQAPIDCDDSQTLRERIAQTQQHQLMRQGKLNAKLNSQELERFCLMNKDASNTARLAIERLGLSARSYFRVIKVARTIADMAQSELIQDVHLKEALSYRNKLPH